MHRKRALVFAALLVSCSSSSIQIATQAVSAGDSCPHGGERLDITQAGKTTSTYVCNGADGASVSVSIAPEPAGSNCAAGGQAITTRLGTGASVTSYVCNGATGAGVVATVEPAGPNCADGGIKLVDGAGQTSYVCNGAPGTAGQSVTVTTASSDTCPAGGAQLQVGSNAPVDVCNGATGTSVTLTAEAPGANCANGGEKVQVGSSTSYVCNGTDGQSVTLTPESPGENCPFGGDKLQVGSGTPEYVCNGSSLGWSTIIANAQAASNQGYIADSSAALTLTLPSSASLSVGDEIDLLVQGTGAVTIARNSGQFFDGLTDLPPSDWTQTSLDAQRWDQMASSADGSHLVVTGLGLVGVSADSGATWTVSSPASLSSVPWTGAAISADGTHVALATYPSGVCTSQDSGATWTLQPNSPGSPFVASSADGSHLLAADDANTKLLQVSTDYGATWTSTSVPSNDWYFGASSADGTHLVAGVNGGPIYASTDSGQTWTQSNAPSLAWQSIASSSDGTQVIAGVNGNGGGLYISTDSGMTWTQTSAPTENWISVASSADGTRLMALALGTGVYMSADAGATWTETYTSVVTSTSNWQSVVMSTDGTRLAAADHGVGAHTSAGSLIAHAGSSLVLRYVGNDTFFLTSVMGRVDQP